MTGSQSPEPKAIATEQDPTQKLTIFGGQGAQARFLKDKRPRG